MSSANAKSDNLNLFKWVLVTSLFIFTLVAGYLGYQRYMTLQGITFPWVRPLYRTVQLFATEGGDLKGEIPIPGLLQAARFTAPLTAIVAIIFTLIVIFREQIKRLRISFLRKHVVIIGLGTKGKNIMDDSMKKKGKILVIEQDPLNPHLASLKPWKCLLIEGNATNKNILKKARVFRARKIYLLLGDDSDQIKTCLLIYDLVISRKRKKKNHVECIMHLLKQDYLNILRNHNLVPINNKKFTLNIFNLYENSARELFQNYPPDRTGIPVQSNKYVQLIIFGFGQAGEALALKCAQTGHYLNWRLRTPQVVVFDRFAKEKTEEFKKRYPSYTDYCDLLPVSIEADSPQMIYELEKYLTDTEALTTIVLCFDNRTSNLLLGLQIDVLTPSDPEVPFQVFIRTNDNESFDAVSKKLKPYCLPSRVCSLNAITGCNLDKQAKALHAEFLMSGENKDEDDTHASEKPWEELSQEYRDSNRKAADHIGVKVRGIGCKVELNSDPHPATEMTEDEIILLSELEHRRWNAERTLAGWTFASKKNHITRKTPYLVNWKKLPAKIQLKDRNAVTILPNVLKETGHKIVRKV